LELEPQVKEITVELQAALVLLVQVAVVALVL
jgi:hypothetical protein